LRGIIANALVGGGGGWPHNLLFGLLWEFGLGEATLKKESKKSKQYELKRKARFETRGREMDSLKPRDTMSHAVSQPGEEGGTHVLKRKRVC